jgi:hypothetical protein
MPYVEDGLLATEWQIVVDGTVYKLDLNADLLAEAAKLDGKNVIVTGVLEMRTSWKYDCFGNKDELSRVEAPVIRVETLVEDLRRF